MRVEIRHLRQFVVVAEELHFSRAAARLGIPQPALSAQIKRIETALQLELFERNTHQVRLTPQGESLLAAATAALEQWDESFALAAALRQGRTARVRLGVSCRMDSRVMVEIERSLAAASPGVVVDFTTARSDRLLDDVAGGRVDAALCFAPAHRAGLEYRLVRADPLAVALPAAHRLAGDPILVLDRLREDVWLMPDRSKRSMAWLRDLWAGLRLEMRTMTDSTTAYDRDFLAVAEGRGVQGVSVAVLPQRPVRGVVFASLRDGRIPVELAYRDEQPRPAFTAVVRAVLESQRSEVDLAP